MLKYATDNTVWCGIPQQVIENLKQGITKISEVRTKVCQAAAAPAANRTQPERCAQQSSSRFQQHQDRSRHFRHSDRQPDSENERDAGRVADATGNWVDSLAPAYSRPYLRLARLDRPIGSWLLLMPCWWSVGLAGMHQDRFPSVWHIVLFFIGAFAMRGAGCTWNDLVDRDLDEKVERTRSRPIPSKQVTIAQATLFMLAQALVGCWF